MDKNKKIHEKDITYAALSYLDNVKNECDMAELKKGVKELIEPEGINNKPLLNRSDSAIDQIIGNIVSHRFEEGNAIYEGLIAYSEEKMLSITNEGKKVLKERRKKSIQKEIYSDD